MTEPNNMTVATRGVHRAHPALWFRLHPVRKLVDVGLAALRRIAGQFAKSHRAFKRWTGMTPKQYAMCGESQ